MLFSAANLPLCTINGERDFDQIFDDLEKFVLEVLQSEKEPPTKIKPQIDENPISVVEQEKPEPEEKIEKPTSRPSSSLRGRKKDSKKV